MEMIVLLHVLLASVTFNWNWENSLRFWVVFPVTSLSSSSGSAMRSCWRLKRKMDLMREQAQVRLLGLITGPNNRLMLNYVDWSGTVRDRVRMYFRDAAGIRTASSLLPSSPPSVQVAENNASVGVGVSLEAELLGSEAEGPVGEESANESQIAPVGTPERASNESSSNLSLAGGEDIRAAPASEAEFKGPLPVGQKLLTAPFEPTTADVPTGSYDSPPSSFQAGDGETRATVLWGPATPADLPLGEGSQAEPEPLPSSSSAKPTEEEKEKVRKAEMTDKKVKRDKGSSSSKSTQRDSGRKSFQRRDRQQNQPLRVRGQKKSHPHHACLFCGKEFLMFDQLVSHTRVHTQEKPYFCQACSKEFSQYWVI